MKAITALTLCTSICTANALGSTTVTVVELGKGGTLRRTNNSADISPATPESVLSFWTSLHEPDNHKQIKGLSSQPMVPDIFSKAAGGIVLHFNDATSKTKVMNQFPSKSQVLGELSLVGSQGKNLLNRFDKGFDSIKEASDLKIMELEKEASFKALSIEDEVTTELLLYLNTLHQSSLQSGNTVVLHMISEDNSPAVVTSRRRLEEEDREGEEGEEGEENADDGANDDAYNKNNFYGYYNDYGEWVTNYKTIFQIQYFNVVLWTGVGLFVVAFVANYMVINMPLMQDTLLFGETAKMSGA